MSSSKFNAKSILKCLKNELNINVHLLEEEDMSGIENYLDSGSASLNSILCGNPLGGFPIGKISGLYGPSGCGKSFIMGKTAALAQKKEFLPIIIDTEGTWDARAAGWGLDISQCFVITEDVIETIRNQIVSIIDKYSENIKNGEVKFLIFLDSIGGLKCQKEISDIEGGSSATDMGTRAKALRTLFRAVVNKCSKNKVTFIWSNHSYDNPDPRGIRNAIQNMPGGKAPWYFSSIIVMMRRNEEKDEEQNKDSLIRNSGAIIPMECVKQRFVRPFLRTKTYITYEGGLHRYFGMFEIAKELDVIFGNRTYQLRDNNDESKCTKLGYKKDIILNAKQWEEVIFPILIPIIQKKFSFS